MNEDLIKAIWENEGFKDKGIALDEFTSDISSNDQLREKVWENVFKDKGIALDEFTSDLGIVVNNERKTLHEIKQDYANVELGKTLPNIGGLESARHDQEQMFMKAAENFAQFQVDKDIAEGKVDVTDRSTEEFYDLAKGKGAFQKQVTAIDNLKRDFETDLKSSTVSDVLPFTGLNMKGGKIKLTKGKNKWLTPQEIMESENIEGYTPEQLLKLKNRISADEVIEYNLKSEALFEENKRLENVFDLTKNSLIGQVGQEVYDQFEEFTNYTNAVKNGTQEKDLEYESQIIPVIQPLIESDAFKTLSKVSNRLSENHQNITDLPNDYKNAIIVKKMEQDLQKEFDEDYKNRTEFGRRLNGVYNFVGGFAKRTTQGLKSTGLSVGALVGVDSAERELMRESIERNDVRKATVLQRPLRERIATTVVDGEEIEVAFDNDGKVTQYYDDFGNVKSLNDKQREFFKSDKGKEQIDNLFKSSEENFNYRSFISQGSDLTADILTTIFLTRGIGGALKLGKAGGTLNNLSKSDRLKQVAAVMTQYTGRSTLDGIRNGDLDPQTASLYGFLQSASEAGLSAILPLEAMVGAGKGFRIGNAQSIKNLIKNGGTQNLRSSVGKLTVESAKALGVENLEEMAAEFVSPQINKVFNEYLGGDFEKTGLPSTNELKDVMLLTTFAMGAPVTLSTYKGYKYLQSDDYYKDTLQHVFDKDSKEALDLILKNYLDKGTITETEYNKFNDIKGRSESVIQKVIDTKGDEGLKRDIIALEFEKAALEENLSGDERADKVENDRLIEIGKELDNKYNQFNNINVDFEASGNSLPPTTEASQEGEGEPPSNSSTDGTIDNLFEDSEQLENTKEEFDENISDQEFNDFVNNGNVSEQRLNDIANKVKNQKDLSVKEQAIFTDKTSEINDLIANSENVTKNPSGKTQEVREHINSLGNESFTKEGDMWNSLVEKFPADIPEGEPIGKGEEGRVWKVGDKVVKVKNLGGTENTKEDIYNVIDRYEVSNKIGNGQHPEALVGFTEIDGDIHVVTEQDYIEGEAPTQTEVDAFLDPYKVEDGSYEISKGGNIYKVYDTDPSNFVKDSNGDIHPIDVMIDLDRVEDNVLKNNRQNFINNFPKKLKDYKKVYKNPSQFYNEFQETLKANDVTFRDVQYLYKGLDPDKTLDDYKKEAESNRKSLLNGLKNFGFTNNKSYGTLAIFDDVVKRIAKREGITFEQFWADKFESFNFIDLKANEKPLDALEREVKESNEKLKERLPKENVKKYNNKDKIVTPLQKDIDRRIADMDLGDRGATFMTNAGKIVIYITSDADVNTPLHELAHVYEFFMTDAEKKVVLDWLGETSWERASERFAKGFEQYIANGAIANNKMRHVFDHFKMWLSDIMQSVIGAGKTLSPKVEQLYRGMFYSELQDADMTGENVEDLYEVKHRHVDYEAIAEEAGIELKNDYASIKHKQVTAKADQLGYNIPEEADRNVLKALESIKESEEKGLVVDTGLRVEEYEGIAQVERELVAYKAALEESIEEAVKNGGDVTNVMEDLKDLTDKISDYNRVLMTSNSHTGAFLNFFKSFQVKRDYIAEYKKTMNKIGDTISPITKKELRDQYELLHNYQRLLSKKQSKQDAINQDDATTQASKIIKEIESNPILRTVIGELQKFKPKQLREGLKNNMKNIHKFLNIKFDSDNNSFKDWVEAISNLYKLHPNIQTVEDVVEKLHEEGYTNITKHDVTDAVLSMDIDNGPQLKILEDGKANIKREVTLLGKLNTLITGGLPYSKGGTVSRPPTEQVVELKGLISELMNVIVNSEQRINDSDLSVIVNLFQQLSTTYENYVIGDPDIDTDVSLDEIIEEDINNMLKTLDRIESRLFLSKFGDKFDKKNHKHNVDYINNLFDVSSDFFQKELEKIGIVDDRFALKQLKDLLKGGKLDDRIVEALGKNSEDLTISEKAKLMTSLVNDEDIPSHIAQKMVNNDVLTLQDKKELLSYFRRRNRLQDKLNDLQSDINDLTNLVGSNTPHSEKMKIYDEMFKKYKINQKPVKKQKTNEILELERKIHLAKDDLTKFLHKINERRFIKIGKKIVATPKVILLAFDYSFVLYQGLVAGTIHPIYAASLIPRMIKNSWDFTGKSFEKEVAYMKSRPKYHLARFVELQVGGAEIGIDEEMQWETIFDDVKGVGTVTKGIQQFSNRGYTTYIENLRLYMFEKLSEGITDLDALKEIAEQVNTYTGTSQKFGGKNTTKIISGGIALTQPFSIAPRLYASQIKGMLKMSTLGFEQDIKNYIDTRDGGVVKRDVKEVRKRLKKQTQKAVAGHVVLLAAGYMLNAIAQHLDVDDDDNNNFITPFHKDFGRLKFNQTRFTYLSQVSYVDAVIKWAGSILYHGGMIEKPENASNRWKGSSPGQVLWDEFIKYRFHPSWGIYKGWLGNRDFLNREIKREGREGLSTFKSNTQLSERYLPHAGPIPLTNILTNTLKNKTAIEIMSEIPLQFFGNSFFENPYSETKFVKSYFTKVGFNPVLRGSDYDKRWSKTTKDEFETLVLEAVARELVRELQYGDREPSKKELNDRKQFYIEKYKNQFNR